jgi:tetratricopeptide (TPR) repeat protein
VEKIAVDLPAGSRVAIVAWELPSAGLSDYIMEELTGALVDRRLEVADRQNLEYVYRELNLHMSEDVSDESARSIGKFLGADMVITGQLTELGGPYRYRASAIHVENATRDSVTRLDVRGDAVMRRMVAALANQKTAVKTASYGEGGTSAPKTAGAFLDRGISLLNQGEYESAIADFTQVIVLNPNYAGAYFNRGIAYGKDKRTTTGPSRTIPRRYGSPPMMPMRITTAAMRITTKKTTTGLSRTMKRCCGLTRIIHWPTTISKWPGWRGGGRNRQAASVWERIFFDSGAKNHTRSRNW